MSRLTCTATSSAARSVVRRRGIGGRLRLVQTRPLVAAEPSSSRSLEVGCCRRRATCSRHTQESSAKSQDSRVLRTCRLERANHEDRRSRVKWSSGRESKGTCTSGDICVGVVEQICTRKQNNVPSQIRVCLTRTNVSMTSRVSRSSAQVSQPQRQCE